MIDLFVTNRVKSVSMIAVKLYEAEQLVQLHLLTSSMDVIHS